MAKAIFKGTPWYVYVVFVVAIGLGVAGFCVPPQGEISGSVLTYIGEIIGGVALVEFVVHIPAYLEAGVKAKISHGNTTIAVAADEVKDSELD